MLVLCERKDVSKFEKSCVYTYRANYKLINGSPHLLLFQGPEDTQSIKKFKLKKFNSENPSQRLYSDQIPCILLNLRYCSYLVAQHSVLDPIFPPLPFYFLNLWIQEEKSCSSDCSSTAFD